MNWATFWFIAAWSVVVLLIGINLGVKINDEQHKS